MIVAIVLSYDGLVLNAIRSSFFLASVQLGIWGEIMNIVRVIGFVLAFASPCSFAGLINVEMEGFKYWNDDYTELKKGGRLSLQVDTSGSDSDSNIEKGEYNGAILNASFFNSHSSKEYCLDFSQRNSVVVDLSSSFFTKLSLKGFFLDLDGRSTSFELFLEGTYKEDDRLDNVVEKVSLFSDATKLVMFGDGGFFDGDAPDIVKFSKAVPEPHTALLLLISAMGLGALRWKRIH